MLRALAVVVLCLLSSLSFAQSPVIPTQVDVLVLPAAGDPVTVAPVANRSTVIGVRNADGTVTPGPVCDQPPSSAVPSIVNPTTVAFADPYHLGRDCRVPLPSGLPDGVGYRVVAQFIAPTCQPNVNQPPQTPCVSARSAVGVPPFSVASATLPPVVPTRLVVLP